MDAAHPVAADAKPEPLLAVALRNRPGKSLDAFIAMFDTWRPEDHTTSGYVWLPIIFEEDRFHIEWLDSWDPSVFD